MKCQSEKNAFFSVNVASLKEHPEASFFEASRARPPHQGAPPLSRGEVAP